MRNKSGITLIALIITVIIMLILAGVALSAISGDAGLFGRVQKTAELYNNQAQGEADTVNKIIDMLDEEYIKNINTGANEPDLVEGMKAVVFNEEDGTTKEPETNAEWYNYEEKKWANAETADGSLWVWIPRFAYKITYYTNATKKDIKGTRDVQGYKNAKGEIVTNTGTEPENGLDTVGQQVKSSYGSIDVVFLHETSNQYYKEEGEKIIARNAEEDGYIIHPAFKNGNGNYSNGEWKAELSGFWMAKFQAGFQDEANYESTQITYPVFKGNNNAMNYITIGESYSLAKALNEENNPYKFNTKDSDTHLTKNSEWGAVAYLGYSKYGLDGKNIHINNKNLNNSVSSVYGVTGWVASSADAKETDGSELWYTETGQKGSTTGNITGVYDMSGCTWERVASYIENGHGNLSTYGSSLTSSEVASGSTEYVTIYEHDANYDNTITQTEITDEKRKQPSRNNYKQNDKKYGDAVYETSTSGEHSGIGTGFNNDYSSISHLDLPFFVRGGNWIDNVFAGLFAFCPNDGSQSYNVGFRAVVCPV